MHLGVSRDGIRKASKSRLYIEERETQEYLKDGGERVVGSKSRMENKALSVSGGGGGVPKPLDCRSQATKHRDRTKGNSKG